MSSIIHEIAAEFLENILETLKPHEGMKWEETSARLMKYCRETTARFIRAAAEGFDQELRNDKAGRKRLGLTIKARDRKRMIYTEFGTIRIDRSYYYDKNSGKHRFLLDEILGLPKYERVDRVVGKRLAENAAYVSYARSSDIVTGGELSRQTVRNCIMKVNVPEAAVPEAKRKVKVLHVFADEDHVHMQKAGRKPGKRSRIVPLVTVTEGIRSIGAHRNATIEPVSFVDEEFNTRRLWKTVEGFIEKKYDMDELEKIVIHGDGGNWIRNGLDDFCNVVHVMDGFHFQKALRSLAGSFPERRVKKVIMDAVKKHDQSKADRCIQELLDDAKEDKDLTEKVNRFGIYLNGNWKPIVNRFKGEMPGSCTEGLVSHILSKRFSREPQGWSDEGLGRLSDIRVYLINGGKLKADDLHKEEQENVLQEKYAEYADRVIQHAKEELHDWSIFDGEPFVMDGASGTQMLIQSCGIARDILS
jgi:hypothetical protein